MDMENGSQFIPFSTPQESRSYHYPDGSILTVANVVKIRYAGGYEYLQTSIGQQYVVAPGWMWMQGSDAPWTFRP